VSPEILEQIAAAISKAEAIHFQPTGHDAVYGGDINQSYSLSDGLRHYFVKLNHAKHLPMLQAESSSLTRLRATRALFTPRPVATGIAGSSAFLVLEHCPMQSKGDGKALAQGLIALHRHTSPDDRFGWHEDNYIGTSVQHNRWHSSWHTFWWQERLSPQLEMAYSAGHKGALEKLAAQLEPKLPEILRDHEPQPSLLHGDLWGGNAAFKKDTGEPVIYDPASYYGDRETDIAMTELFGGFSPDFYRTYQEAWPLEPGYEQRKVLYNLYHLLNHLNLFGGAYLSQCQTVMMGLASG
jgi:protein-ribulosamine 3-kinase